MSLLDLITGLSNSPAAEQTENKFGISKSQMIALAAVAAPLIISYLKNKSQDAKEAEALNNALDRDHDGSILDNPSSAFEREQEGSSILDHIFGGNKSSVENGLSQQTGISMDKIGPLLSILAPIVMGYLGKQKQQAGVQNGGGLTDLLGSILGGAQSQAQQQPSNPLNDILGQVLGGGQAQQQQSNPLNDLLGSVLGGGNQQQSQQGGLGGLLGSILGGK